MVEGYEYRYAEHPDDIELESWIPATGPSAVQGFDGDPGTGSITYTWEAATELGGDRPGPVTGFSGEEGVGSITYSWNAAEMVTGTIPITGLLPGTKYAFQTRAKDVAGNYSPPTPVFYATTPYAIGVMTLPDGDVMSDGDGEAMTALVGNYLEPAE